MSTDRELLELAAKAAGIRARWLRYGPEGEEREGMFDVDAGVDWTPLEDDGDALRLAIKLLLEVNATIPDKPTVSVYGNNRGRMVVAHEQRLPDIYAATRRAIVRAAAEIGKTMPSP